MRHGHDLPETVNKSTQLLSLSSLVVLAKYENQINVFSDYLEELPDSDEPVWILGKRYNIKTGTVWLFVVLCIAIMTGANF